MKRFPAELAFEFGRSVGLLRPRAPSLTKRQLKVPPHRCSRKRNKMWATAHPARGADAYLALAEPRAGSQCRLDGHSGGAAALYESLALQISPIRRWSVRNWRCHASLPTSALTTITRSESFPNWRFCRNAYSSTWPMAVLSLSCILLCVTVLTSKIALAPDGQEANKSIESGSDSTVAPCAMNFSASSLMIRSCKRALA